MKEARHLARCRICREGGPRLAEHLRARSVPAVTAAERERLWRGIRRAIEAEPVWSLPAIVPRLRGLIRRRPMLAWAPAFAAAILLALMPMHTGREERVLSQAALNAQTTIEHIDAGPSTSVFVLETPKEHLSIIWVTEPRWPGRSS